MTFKKNVRVENHFRVEIFEIFHFQKHAPNMDISRVKKFQNSKIFTHTHPLVFTCTNFLWPTHPPLGWHGHPVGCIWRRCWLNGVLSIDYVWHGCVVRILTNHIARWDRSIITSRWFGSTPLLSTRQHPSRTLLAPRCLPSVSYRGNRGNVRSNLSISNLLDLVMQFERQKL